MHSCFDKQSALWGHAVDSAIYLIGKDEYYCFNSFSITFIVKVHQRRANSTRTKQRLALLEKSLHILITLTVLSILSFDVFILVSNFKSNPQELDYK